MLLAAAQRIRSAQFAAMICYSVFGLPFISTIIGERPLLAVLKSLPPRFFSSWPLVLHRTTFVPNLEVRNTLGLEIAA